MNVKKSVLILLLSLLTAFITTGCEEAGAASGSSSLTPATPSQTALNPPNDASVNTPLKNRIYIVHEGNMSNQEGALSYLDENGIYHERAFEEVNKKTIGNVLQDIYFANDRIYMITQNGPKNKDDGAYLVIADEKSLKEIVRCGKNSSFHQAKSPDGIVIWPQHITVVSRDKAYVRYSTADMEQSSGVRILDLKTNTLGKDIMDLYGPFPGVKTGDNGASKMRMLYTAGKVFVPCGEVLKVLDPLTDKIVKSIPIADASQIKGIVKTPDGSVWISTAGIYAGSGFAPTFSSKAKVTGINPKTYEIISEIELPCDLPVATFSSHVGMCASPVKDEIYMWGGSGFNMSKIYRIDCNTETAALYKDVGSGYGYLGVDKKGLLYVGSAPGFMSTLVRVIDTATGNLLPEEYSSAIASPSGIDFPFRS